MKSGFVLLDKPVGITSRQAGFRVSKIFNAKTFGHIGTLDPMASGLIIIALGEATKMIPFLEMRTGAVKEYLFSIKWGVRTDSLDTTGKVIEEGGRLPKNTEITAVLQNFPKEYEQMPPAFSAKKINGVPAYVLARKGSEPNLVPKKVKIYELTICLDPAAEERDNSPLPRPFGHPFQLRQGFDGQVASEGEYKAISYNLDPVVKPRDDNRGTGISGVGHETAKENAVFRVVCSRGTYVRSLVRDIAEKLGVLGTCSMIRRIQTDGFHIKDACRLDFLENLVNTGSVVSDYLKPLDFGLAGIPVLRLEITDAALFSNGGFVRTRSSDGLTRVYSENEFIGIGTVEQGVLKPKRIINVYK